MKELARNNKIGSIIITVLILFLSLFMLISPVYAKEETKFDTLLYLHCALTPDDYGGIYMKDDNYHIKPLAQSRTKIEQVVAKANQLTKNQPSSPKVIIDDNGTVSIRELALTKRILTKLPVDYRYDVYLNCSKNAVSIARFNWTEDAKQEMREFAGVDHISFENHMLAESIGYGYDFLFRLDTNSVEWYKIDSYDYCINFESAGYMNSPAYQKNGEWMIPLKDFINSFPLGSSFSWDESKKEAMVMVHGYIYLIDMNNNIRSLQGFQIDTKNLTNVMEMHDGVLYISAKTAFNIANKMNFQKEILYSPEYKTISKTLEIIEEAV